MWPEGCDDDIIPEPHHHDGSLQQANPHVLFYTLVGLYQFAVIHDHWSIDGLRRGWMTLERDAFFLRNLVPYLIFRCGRSAKKSWPHRLPMSRELLKSRDFLFYLVSSLSVYISVSCVQEVYICTGCDSRCINPAGSYGIILEIEVRLDSGTSRL